MQRKFISGAVMEAEGLGPRQIRVRASTGVVDRVGDVLVPKGCRLRTASVPVLLDHKATIDSIVGRAAVTGFANAWVQSQGGTAGVWSATANSTAAVNGAPGSVLTGQNGGNFITSNETYTEATVVAELTGLINKLDSANVPDRNRVWFFSPRTYNYLFGLLNSLGLYVFRDELSKGTLYGYPFKKTNQIPNNLWDATGTNKDCSFILLAEMNEAMILDSMSLELAVSREGTYTDAGGNTVSAFQYDQTVIRAIAEHDFQLRHDSGVAVDQFVRWAPALQ